MAQCIKVMEEKNLQPRIFYPVKLSFRFNREIKSFANKQVKITQRHQTSLATYANSFFKWKRNDHYYKQENCKWKSSLVKASTAFSSGTVLKNPPANSEDTGDTV